MSQFFEIHPDNPQPRLIRRATEILLQGGLLVYPTDSCYALGCRMGIKSALERMRRVRRLGTDHTFTLVCRDLSEISTYARIDNVQYRLLRHHTPGPYTFVLAATHEVPRRVLHPKRRTIGIRVPENPVTQALLGELGEPIMSTSLILPNASLPLTDPYEIRDLLQGDVDLVIDAGPGDHRASSVIDMTGDTPVIIRAGKGDVGFVEDALA